MDRPCVDSSNSSKMFLNIFQTTAVLMKTYLVMYHTLSCIGEPNFNGLAQGSSALVKLGLGPDTSRFPGAPPLFTRI